MYSPRMTLTNVWSDQQRVVHPYGWNSNKTDRGLSVGLLNECINKSLHGSSISHPRRMTKATHIPPIQSCWDVNGCRDEINGRHWHFVMDL